VESGSVVGTHYDPMLAKVIAWAPERTQAALLLADTLARMRLHGLGTNRDLLVNVLREQDFLAGNTDTAFFDRHGLDTLARPLAGAAAESVSALVAALALDARDRAVATVLAPAPSGWRNVPSQPQRRVLVGPSGERDVRYAFCRDGLAFIRDEWHPAQDETGASRARDEPGPAGEKPAASGAQDETGASGAQDETGASRARDETGASRAQDEPAPAQEKFAAPGHPDVVLLAHCPEEVVLEVAGVRRKFAVAYYPAEPLASGAEVFVDSPLGSVRFAVPERFADSVRHAAPGSLLAPMPGTVLAVAVDVGDHVGKGQVLITLEAMKMQHQITAPADGTVTELLVSPGQQVDADAVLAVIAPHETAPQDAARDRAPQDPAAQDAATQEQE
jgi:propionyl-CoA carboxylase alpha chain